MAMKTILFFLILFSTNSFAVRMCPRGVAEIVSCKEQSTYSVSVCRDDQDYFISFQNSPLARTILFPAMMAEEADSYVYTRLGDGEDVFELTINKSVDDHTRGTLKTLSGGLSAEYFFRCLSRNIHK